MVEVREVLSVHHSRWPQVEGVQWKSAFDVASSGKSVGSICKKFGKAIDDGMRMFVML